MPKKKDKQNEDKKKTPKKDSPADKTASDDKEKNVYLIQLRYLNEQLERYQLKSDELGKEKEDLKAQYSTLEKEKKDIVDFLKRSLLEKEDEVDELTEHLENQRQAADEERDGLQLQHNQLRQELQAKIEGLTEENRTLVARLTSLEEFQKQKDQLMFNMESLKTQLASQKDEHKTDLHNLEMKALLEKKRLEQDMESHVAAMAEEVNHLVDQKVPETTRLALEENAELKARLNELAEQAQALMKENTALQDRKTQLSLDVDILEKMLSETARQSCIHKKVVEQLTDKCQQLQAQQKTCRQEVEQLQTEHKGLVAQMEALRQERASLLERSSTDTAEASRLQAELEEERRRRSRMKSTMEEAAIVLRQALMETPTEQDSVVLWKTLLQKLLVLLDGQALNDTAAARADSRYKLNDLSLVAPPALKHKSLLSRSAVPLHRKPSNQKTTSSPNLTDSAAGFLTPKRSVTKLK